MPGAGGEENRELLFNVYKLMVGILKKLCKWIVVKVVSHYECI